MFDVALTSAGAQIPLSTSCDEHYPPENMIDGKPDTFWITTGLFPQQFIITFQSLMNINNITIESTGIRDLKIERSVQNEPNDFEGVDERCLDNTGDSLQSEDFSMSGSSTAQHLRFTIESGHDHFVSVHKLKVDGNAVHN